MRIRVLDYSIEASSLLPFLFKIFLVAILVDWLGALRFIAAIVTLVAGAMFIRCALFWLFDEGPRIFSPIKETLTSFIFLILGVYFFLK